MKKQLSGKFLPHSEDSVQTINFIKRQSEKLPAELWEGVYTTKTGKELKGWKNRKLRNMAKAVYGTLEPDVPYKLLTGKKAVDKFQLLMSYFRQGGTEYVKKAVKHYCDQEKETIANDGFYPN